MKGAGKVRGGGGEGREGVGGGNYRLSSSNEAGQVLVFSFSFFYITTGSFIS